MSPQVFSDDQMRMPFLPQERHFNSMHRHEEKCAKSPWRTLRITLALVIASAQLASAFHSSASSLSLGTNLAVEHQRISVFMVKGNCDEDSRVLVQRARAVLEKSKAKLAAREESETSNSSSSNTETMAAAVGAGTPFFAQLSLDRELVVKSRDDKTGLITANGEVMAAISEQEDWEMRSLSEVFDNEMDENADVYSLASQQLAKRDVAASIWNMRKHLEVADFLKIFDKGNYFIGETD